ncbi:hypothetical protein NL676_003928 [Syzygium grande]|nr:hypothetical protein NL676_003928 [Syzygium grande]
MLALAFRMSSKDVADLAGMSFLRDHKRKYAGYQRRNILHLKPYAKLRIVSTIHRPDNVAALLNLLDATCATKERTVALYGLHLVDLVGRASPVFNSHRMQKRTPIRCSYSENIITALSHYEQDHWDAGSANDFTAISPPRLMHGDICMSELNKLSYLTVYAFTVSGPRTRPWNRRTKSRGS